jgi:hypothetical protein
MAIGKITSKSLDSNAVTSTNLAPGAVTIADIADGEITAGKLHTTLDLSTKTLTLTQASVTAHQGALSVTQSQISDLSTTSDLSEGTNKYYTDARADARVALLVDSAPGTLDTLNELAAALGDDANFSTTVTNSIATKLPLAGGTLTGNVTFGDNNKAIFGAGSDLQVYHDGNNGYIKNDTGKFQIFGEQGNVAINVASGYGNAVSLEYANSTKLQTTSTGVYMAYGASFGGDIITSNFANGTSGQKYFQAKNSFQSGLTDGSIFGGMSFNNIRSGTTTGITGYIRGVANGTSGNMNLEIVTGTAGSLTQKVLVKDAGVDITGNIAVTGTVDGVDIAARDAILTSTTTTADAALPKAGGTMTGTLNIDVADLFVKDTTGGALGQVQIGAGTAQGFINIQKGDGTRNVQLSSDGDSFLNGGNVGIGNDSPSAPLHIKKSISSTYTGGNTGIVNSLFNITNTLSTSTVNAQANIQLGVYDGTYNRVTGIAAVAESATNRKASLVFWTDDENTRTEKLRITGDGNVGIGTDDPDSPLVVNSSSGGNTFKLLGRSADNISSLTFSNAGNTASNYIQGNSSFIRARADGGFHFRKGGTPVTTDTGAFTVNGLNVGIGVTSPSNKLEVDGSIAFTKNGTSGNRWLLIDGADGTYAGTMNIQAGFGSNAAGGAIKLYAHQHATYPGSTWIGRSAGSAGNIMFGNGGTGPSSASEIQMVIDSSGKVGINTSSNLGAKLNVSQAGQNSIGSTGHISHKLSSNDSNYNISRLDTSGNFLVDQYGTGGWRNSYSITANNDAMSINDQLFVDKTIYTYTDSGAKYYTHLCTHSAYQTVGTILINTNIPGHNVSGNANMFSFRVTGFWYDYRAGGTIDMVVGAYAGEGDYYNTTVTGSYPAAWKGKIWFATNSNGKVMLILGDNGTTQKCEIAVTDFVQGYVNVNASYAVGWTISATNTSYTATQQREAHPRTTGGMQIIDGTARTALYSSSGTFTVSQTNTFTPIGSLSDFKIDVHVNVGVSDDEGGGNMNPYANGVIQRRINSGSWTTADNTGISNQGGVSCHVEMSPPRVGTNANTDTYMTQQDRYRTKNHSSTFIDRPGINAGDTLQYRLICNLTNGNHIQIGEPVGFQGDDDYMAQPFGFMITEFTPWE